LAAINSVNSGIAGSNMRMPLPYSPLKRAITEQLRSEAETETTISEEHRLISELCDRLEHVADALPGLPDPQQMSELVALLKVGIPAHCAAEEAAMAELLQRSPEPPEAVRDALELIRQEHAENEANTMELADMLEEMKGLTKADDPNTLGFMLRQVFVLIRRHLAWEEYVLAHVLPEG
jgi:hemerythrin-like domain-containing protein